MNALEKLLLSVILASALVAGGYFWGHVAASNECDSGKLQQQNQVIETKEKKQEAGRQVAQEYEDKRSKRSSAFVSIDKRGNKNEANNPSYRTCGLDADGLRIWRDANAGIESDAGAGAIDRAAELTGSGLGLARRPGEESPGSGQGISRTGGPVPGAGEMDP